MSGCGLTAIPHIESRVRRFRTGAIEIMLTKSGFCWDDTTKMVQCEKQQYDKHCEEHPDARGLYGILFPHLDTLAAIYGKDIATREGAEGLADAVANIEKEATLKESRDWEVEEQSMSETPRWGSDRNSLDSTSSSSKRRKRDKGTEGSKSNDPFLDIVGGLRGDLKSASNHFGKMADVMEREAKVKEEAAHEDPMQALQKKAIDEMTRLGFTGSELLKAAKVFVNAPNQMTMIFALPENLRREFIQNMLHDSLYQEDGMVPWQVAIIAASCCLLAREAVTEETGEKLVALADSLATLVEHVAKLYVTDVSIM